jgi:hypothetical protein
VSAPVAGRGGPAPVAEPRPVPPWIRAVAWDSLLGGLCPLLPLPVVDDLALARRRTKLVDHLLQRWGIAVSPRARRWLAGGSRAFSPLRFAAKAIIYPFKEVARKVLYFLAVKDAADAFSLLFHQGYLLHVALAHGALGRGGAVDDERAWRVAWAVHETLSGADTKTVRRLVLGVWRSSGRLLRTTLRAMARPLSRRSGGGLPEAPPPAEGGAVSGSAAPEAQLLDRMLLALWMHREELERLERALLGRLQ